MAVSQNAIFYALKKLGISNKKTLVHPKANPQARQKFKRKLLWYKNKQKRPIVYIDESGFSVNAPRERGYSAKGEPCYGYKDWNCKGRVNAIGALMGFKLLNVCLFDPNINADIFYLWVVEELLNSLPKNNVVVLDNAAFHKRNGIITVIEENGHTLVFLPPYSPDLNPIEQIGHKQKN